ncbi:histidine phosphatase family protein [Streptomyces sp. NPDC091209]|uniref:histidine phosphatase family protein n=1 Tax=Streptomyces sp. NPDC091209 TaxID=3365974 RepID=UPI0038263BBF
MSGQHAGRTGIPLADAGAAAANSLAPRLARRHLVAVLSSPLSRAPRTAELAGLTGVRADSDLMEWDYGGCESLTAAQPRRRGRAGTCAGTASFPATPAILASSSSRWPRADAALDRIRPLLNDGDVAVVAHGHLARVLTVRRLGLDVSAGRLLGHPHPGTLSFLATEDEQPLIAAWNVP